MVKCTASQKVMIVVIFKLFIPDHIFIVRSMNVRMEMLHDVFFDKNSFLLKFRNLDY